MKVELLTVPMCKGGPDTPENRVRYFNTDAGFVIGSKIGNSFVKNGYKSQLYKVVVENNGVKKRREGKFTYDTLVGTAQISMIKNSQQWDGVAVKRRIEIHPETLPKQKGKQRHCLYLDIYGYSSSAIRELLQANPIGIGESTAFTLSIKDCGLQLNQAKTKMRTIEIEARRTK